jgi:hypothetical protein
MDHFEKYFNTMVEFCKTKLTKTSAEAISWIGLVLIHAATVPTVLSVMAGLNDKLPPIDMILFMWAGLVLFFIRAAILKDMIILITVGLGFVIHTVLLSLLVFK